MRTRLMDRNGVWQAGMLDGRVVNHTTLRLDSTKPTYSLL